MRAVLGTHFRLVLCGSYHRPRPSHAPKGRVVLKRLHLWNVASIHAKFDALSATLTSLQLSPPARFGEVVMVPNWHKAKTETKGRGNGGGSDQCFLRVCCGLSPLSSSKTSTGPPTILLVAHTSPIDPPPPKKTTIKHRQTSQMQKVGPILLERLGCLP